MFDPAIIQDLQRAMAPPPAIERTWLSPMAEKGERVTGPWVEGAEKSASRWREALHDAGERIASTSAEWDEANLAGLDATIRKGNEIIAEVGVQADNSRRKGLRANKAIARRDAAAAVVQKSQVKRFHAIDQANIKAMQDFVARLRTYRGLVDTRTGAEPGYEPKAWTPNTATLEAVREARAGIGMRRANSVAEMMAALHAEDD